LKRKAKVGFGASKTACLSSANARRRRLLHKRRQMGIIKVTLNILNIRNMLHILLLRKVESLLMPQTQAISSPNAFHLQIWFLLLFNSRQ
jgi:hypothetical protein